MLRSVSRGNDPNSVAVSNNVSPQSRFSILDLESGTKYELRVTAYNNAGSTQAEYLFSTLSPTGSNRMHDEQPPETEETSLFFDAHVLAPSVISLLAVFLAVAGVCFCLKTRKSCLCGQTADLPMAVVRPLFIRNFSLRTKRIASRIESNLAGVRVAN